MTDAARAAFRREQRGVAGGMALALVLGLAAIGWALIAPAGGTLPVEARLRLVLGLDLTLVGWLLATVANVARLRFLSPEDIGGSAGEAEGAAVRTGRAVLQNTLQQVVLAVPVHAALAVLMPAPTRLLAVLVLLFAIGRAAFWTGYARGARARAFGFALTFYPTAVAWLLALAYWRAA